MVRSTHLTVEEETVGLEAPVSLVPRPTHPQEETAITFNGSHDTPPFLVLRREELLPGAHGTDLQNTFQGRKHFAEAHSHDGVED